MIVCKCMVCNYGNQNDIGNQKKWCFCLQWPIELLIMWEECPLVSSLFRLWPVFLFQLKCRSSPFWCWCFILICIDIITSYCTMHSQWLPWAAPGSCSLLFIKWLNENKGKKKWKNNWQADPVQNTNADKTARHCPCQHHVPLPWFECKYHMVKGPPWTHF